MNNRRMSPLLVALVLLAGLLSACADQPFSEGPQIAIGVVEEGFGDQYTLSAEELSVAWTFTETAPFTLSFEDGTVMYGGVGLEPGCYSGESEIGEVLEYDRAQEVEFATPEIDTECEGLP